MVKLTRAHSAWTLASRRPKLPEQVYRHHATNIHVVLQGAGVMPSFARFIYRDSDIRVGREGVRNSSFETHHTSLLALKISLHRNKNLAALRAGGVVGPWCTVAFSSHN